MVPPKSNNYILNLNIQPDFISFKISTLILFFILIFSNVIAQDITITTADIISSVTDGSTTATISKSGTDLVITKTGGSTTPVHVTYPNGAPMNTIAANPTNNIEGLHLGKTWGTNGTGWIDSYGQLRSETNTFEITEKLLKFEMIIGAMNDNADGIEQLRIVDVRDNGVSVLSDVTFSIRVDYDDASSDSLVFDSGTRTIKGQDYPKATGWNESSLFTIESDVEFDQILLERYDLENNRTDVNVNGRNYTNGISLTYMGVYYASSTLPVNLIQFKGKKVFNNIQLDWATSQEVNNEGFSVFWKNNQNSWEKIDYIKGIGNSNNVNNYTISHSNPNNGINYYKLIQYDFDGKTDTSSIITVNFDTNTSNFSVFPNPSNGIFKVSASDNYITKIEVLNTTGQLLLDKNYTSETSCLFDLSSFSKGVYFLKI